MFEDEQRQIIDSLKTPNDAKSWLILGPRGVGKSAFAKQLANALTNEEKDFNPNVCWVECGLTDAAKREIQKAILEGELPEDKEWAKKTEITVDDIREGCHFLSLKSDKIKVLIINLADDMNENAQNALLKTLEEPYPNTLLLLLCENVGRLLPTILSRCQKLHLHPLSLKDIEIALKKKYSDLAEDDLKTLAFLSEGTIGVADEIVQLNALETYQELLTFFVPRKQLDVPALLSWAESVSRKPKLFTLVCRFILLLLVQRARGNAMQSIEYAFNDAELYDKISTLFHQVSELNLDKKQVLIVCMYQISEAL